MAETVTMHRNLEYTTAGDIILTQSGTITVLKPQRHLSRTTPWKRRNRKFHRILKDPLSWNDGDDATYVIVSCDIELLCTKMKRFLMRILRLLPQFGNYLSILTINQTKPILITQSQRILAPKVGKNSNALSMAKPLVMHCHTLTTPTISPPPVAVNGLHKLLKLKISQLAPRTTVVLLMILTTRVPSNTSFGVTTILCVAILLLAWYIKASWTIVQSTISVPPKSAVPYILVHELGSTPRLTAKPCNLIFVTCPLIPFKRHLKIRPRIYLFLLRRIYRNFIVLQPRRQCSLPQRG